METFGHETRTPRGLFDGIADMPCVIADGEHSWSLLFLPLSMRSGVTTDHGLDDSTAMPSAGTVLLAA
jgi:hypothetical protein